MIDFGEYKIFADHMSTLKKISSDDSDKDNVQYMTNSEIEAIDFDKVKTKYANDLCLSEEVASSFDALLNFFDGIVFVEFKNGKMKNAKANVKNKVRDSLLIFCDIIGKSISYTRENIDFILVYNEEKNPMPTQISSFQKTESRAAIAAHFIEKSKEEFIRFDLERFKTLYFRKVHTFTEEQFDMYLKSKKLCI